MSAAAAQTPPIPEFLCLKYKGVRRLDQIIAQAETFGWKCRKYQNWKQIHVHSTDKSLLKSVGDALVEHGNFDPKDFGRISEIFFNVQRWRADREHMVTDPPLLGSWSELDTLLHVIRQRPSVLSQKLKRDFTGSESLSKDSAPTFFFGSLLLQMLKEQGVPFATALDLHSSMPTQQWDELLQQVLQHLYSVVGLRLPRPQSPNLRTLAQAFADLGFAEPSFDPGSYEWDTGDPTPLAVTIRYSQLSPSVLMKVDFAEGATVLVLNSQHPFLIDIAEDQIAKGAVERLLSAYAEAMQQMPSCGDDFSLFTSLIGMILRRK